MNRATATTTIMMRLHGRTAAGVPRWAVWTAYATALTALPYYRRRTGDRTDPLGGAPARSGRWPDSAGEFEIGGK
ncbi:hypothetical protein [Streptosporangium canum]|uniref:hypothetical protein n=1 Tax=Streptosporangium canum TaxID=324952 RepID=UPI00339E83C0